MLCCSSVYRSVQEEEHVATYYVLHSSFGVGDPFLYTLLALHYLGTKAMSTWWTGLSQTLGASVLKESVFGKERGVDSLLLSSSSGVRCSVDLFTPSCLVMPWTRTQRPHHHASLLITNTYVRAGRVAWWSGPCLVTKKICKIFQIFRLIECCGTYI